MKLLKENKRPAVGAWLTFPHAHPPPYDVIVFFKDINDNSYIGYRSGTGAWWATSKYSESNRQFERICMRNKELIKTEIFAYKNIPFNVPWI